ncbi:MAG: oxidoreductase [Chloroflexota bacterium]
MPRLDEPLVIHGMRLRNRLVLPPTTTNYCTAEGEVTDGVVGFYRQRSRAVGLVVAEAAAVRPDGRITPYSMGLWSDALIPGLKRLAQAIKGEGAVAAVQIGHAGAGAVVVEGGLRRPSPSAIATKPGPAPAVLSEAQISEIVSDFADGAARAAEAGFDAVEIHGAHLYLISQFLSPLTNRRQDRYGGKAEERATFAAEVVRAIRDRLGADYPILFRFNAVELTDGGQRIEEGVAVAQLLEKAGVNLLHSSLVAQAAWKEDGEQRFLQSTSALLKDQPYGAALPYAAQVKRSVSVPVIAVGKLGAPAEAARAVEQGLVDLVAIGRQMIVDPLTAGKILSGRGGELVLCKECRGCFASISKGMPMVCTVNRDPAGAPAY